MPHIWTHGMARLHLISKLSHRAKVTNGCTQTRINLPFLQMKPSADKSYRNGMTMKLEDTQVEKKPFGKSLHIIIGQVLERGSQRMSKGARFANR